MDSTSKESPNMILFNSTEKADLVVRSCDGVHFFVAKFFLIYNSEFFANLLTDSVPEQRHDGLPMFLASENSPTMCMVLKLCYPCHIVDEDIDLENIMGWPAVRDALRKYMMEDAEARFVAHVKSAASRMIKSDPQKCFVLARWAGLDDLARAAAKETLRVPFHDRKAFEELALVSALEYRRLLDYFRSSGSLVTKKLSPNTLKLQAETRIYSAECAECKLSLVPVALAGPHPKLHHYYVHPWVRDAIQESQRMVREYRSAGFLDEESCDRLLSVACKSCSSQTPERVRSILNAINKQVEKIVSEVEFTL